MSDFTPTSVRYVRDAYCDSEARHENHGAWVTEEQHDRFHAQFDRWIAAHNRDVRRQALLDAHALCTTTTDAAAISRLIEAERTEADG